MQSEKLIYTVGILGAGQIVANMHLPVLRSMPEMKVLWISDANAQRARELGEAFKVGARAVPLAELPETDIVLIAVPYGVREPIYDTLRLRQNALYVEKPFARTVEQHKRYCGWFAHTKIAIGFQRRALGSAQLLRKIISSRIFGDLTRVRVEYGVRGVLTGSSYSSDFRLAGGGLLFEVAIHYIDLALSMMSAVSAEITGGRMLRQENFDLHTEATFRVRTQAGAELEFEILATGLQDSRNETTLRFSSGVELIFSPSGEITLPVTQSNAAADELNIGLNHSMQTYPVSALQLCHEMWSGLLVSMRTGAVTLASAEDSLVTTVVIESLYGLEA